MATKNPPSEKTGKSPSSITEGRATIVLPPGVFYNPVQEFNRDLTVAVINEFSKIFYRDGIGRKATINTAKRKGDQELGGNKEFCNNADRTDVAEGEEIPELRILDALSATGLRAVRYALEVRGRLQITANDIDSTAVEVIKQNSGLNKVSNIVVPVCNDAALLMHKNNGEVGRYHVVDLDPYGSPTHFLDAAVQAVEYGGLLCVTCTDMAVLCGRASTTCYAKYGSTSIPNTPHIHETALRIILSTVSSHANRYGRYIQPLLSVSIDFYARIFVRVYKGKEGAKQSAERVGMLYSCSGCKSFSTQPLGKVITDDKSTKYKPAIGPPVDKECAFCGWTHHIGGPIWLDPIHDLNFVKDVLTSLDVESHQYKTVERINGILTMITEELQDVPLHYTTQQLCTTLNTSMPKTQKLWSAIKNAGYRVSYSHTEKSSLKTNMPADLLWDLMKCYASSEEAVSKIPPEQSPGHKIVSTPIKFVADFTLREGVLPMSKVDNLKRFPENPPNWGPQSRAKKSKKTSNSPQDENLSELQDGKKVRQEINEFL